ncbi:protein SLC31A2-like isoform X3 [Periplaneta americana]
MHMSYWFGTSVGDLLFKGFTISSTSGLVMTCFGLASFAILFEAVKVYQAYAKHKVILDDDHCYSENCTNERSLLLRTDGTIKKAQKLLILARETGWYVIQIVMSYILMLCVMTYNGYFTVAVSIGAGIGYLIFGMVLIEIGLKTGGIRHPKRLCPACLETTKTEDCGQTESDALPEVAHGMVHCAAVQEDLAEHQNNDNSPKGQCHHEIVTEVHRADV